MSDLGNKQIMGANITRLLDRRGIDRKKLATDLGYKYTTVSDWVNGKTYPRIDKIEGMAQYFGVPKSDLVESPTNKSLKIAESTTYNYIDAGISAGQLQTVDPFMATDLEQIALSNVVMGRYANDSDLFITRVNGDSMNRTIPDGSLIAVKKLDSVEELKNDDIVVFQYENGMSVKRFFNDRKSSILAFQPDSLDREFQSILIRYEEAEDVKIIGKVVVYVVEM